MGTFKLYNVRQIILSKILSLQNSLTTLMLNYKWFCMNIDKNFSSCCNSYYFNFQWKFIPLVGILRSWRHTPHSHNELNLIMKVHFYFYAPAFFQDFFNLCIKIIFCGSCHLDRVSNIEIGIEYRMTFVVVKHILGHLQGLKKVGWFHYENCRGIGPTFWSKSKQKSK